MTSSRLFVSCALVLGAVTAGVGCSATAAESPAASSDDALTSVLDLSEMESMLGLSKDVKDQNGNWSRSDERLKAGPCYQRLMGAGGDNYELRRYYEGAAFFPKEASLYTGGAARAVLCVDVDIWEDDGTKEGSTYTTEISDITLDAILRYRLGRPTGGDGAAGTFYDEYQFGTVSWHGGYCGDTDHPFQASSFDALESYCFGSIDGPGASQVSGALQVLVYQYAEQHAFSGTAFGGRGDWSMKADPAGRFINLEGDYENQVVHFEKIDATAKSLDDGNKQVLTLSQKNGDVILKCVRTQGDEKWNVTCGQ